METISSREFFDICSNPDTKIIKYGKVDQPKVYEKNENIIIKLFYPKHDLLSSDRIWPRAVRFYNNVTSLRSQGYEVPEVIKFQFCPDLRMYVLQYSKIQGNDIRALARQGQLDLLNDVAELLAKLHKDGIFFRSIHLENVLCTPDRKMALIDIADVRFKSRPLNVHLRYRNIKHVLLHRDDKVLCEAFGVDNFMKAYFKAAGLSGWSRKLLSRWINKAVRGI